MLDIFNFVTSNKKVPTGPIEYLIVGLGNPGKNYDNTRHNAGFMAIDYIAEKCGVSIDRLKFKSLYTDTLLESKRVILMKPQLYMNNSGQSVVEAMSFYKIPSNKVIILFDDICLNIGKIRIRRKGSDGGHNGVKNIIYLSAKEDFLRVKIGIGGKPHPGWDLADWVLSNFTPEEKQDLNLAIENCYNSLKLIVSGKIQDAMNKYN